MIALTISPVFTFSLLSIQNILFIISTVPISSLIPRWLIQVLTLKLFFSVIDIFVYFYLIQAHLHSSILNLLSILTISKLLAICIILSIFLLFQVCVY
jgi:hypothetical protein